MQKISKGLFWIVSVMLFVIFIYACIQKVYNAAFVMLIIGGISNPCILDKLSIMFEKRAFDYWYAFRVLSIFLTLFLAFIVAVLIFLFTNKEIVDVNEAKSNLESILKIVIYLSYIAVLLINKSADKFSKYLIFMFFYITCVILSFASKSIIELIIAILNFLPNSNLDLDGYEILFNDILIPIREAILTYIILDTIIENKHKELQTDDNIQNEKNDRVIEENKRDKDISILKNQIYNVEVTDRSINKSMIYKIHVRKKSSHQ